MPVRVWSREEVLALPDDGNRYELIDGELLVSPSPHWVHQRAVLALYRRIDPFTREHKLGSTMLAPADLDLQSEQLVQPDLFVVPLRADGREPLDWRECGVPFLIAEVSSPSTVRHDRTTKRRRFQRSGVAEYWIVDHDSRTFERWTPADERPLIVDDEMRWSPTGAKEPLVIDVAKFFREVWDER